MSTSHNTLITKFFKMLGVVGVTGTLATASFGVLAQSAQQRPAPSTNQVNGSFGGSTNTNTNTGSVQERPNAPVTPGSGMAVDGGTAGVVVNNYNSSYNTVTVSK